MAEKEKSTGKAGKKKQTPEKPVKQLTLKQRIDKTVDDWKDSPGELKKQIFGLVQRVLYPDQFCPECDGSLFFSPSGWSCPNCGFQRNPNQNLPSTVSTTTRPSQTGKVPPQVEKMIKNTQEPRRVVAPTKRGTDIRKLVDQMDSGGSSAPTPQDEANVRKDPNVKGKVNWV